MMSSSATHSLLRSPPLMPLTRGVPTITSRTCSRPISDNAWVVESGVHREDQNTGVSPRLEATKQPAGQAQLPAPSLQLGQNHHNTLQAHTLTHTPVWQTRQE